MARPIGTINSLGFEPCLSAAKAELDQAAKAYPALSTETLEQQLCSLHSAILSDLIGWLQKAGLKQL